MSEIRNWSKSSEALNREANEATIKSWRLERVAFVVGFLSFVVAVIALGLQLRGLEHRLEEASVALAPMPTLPAPSLDVHFGKDPVGMPLNPGDRFEVFMSVANTSEELLQMRIGVQLDDGLTLIEDSIRMQQPSDERHSADITSEMLNIGVLMPVEQDFDRGLALVSFMIQVDEDAAERGLIGQRLEILSFVTGYDIHNNRAVTHTAGYFTYINVIAE